MGTRSGASFPQRASDAGRELRALWVDVRALRRPVPLPNPGRLLVHKTGGQV